MIFKVVLNGCSSNIAAQAEELNGFVNEYLCSQNHAGGTILFCSKKEGREALLGFAPTGSVDLVRIDRCRPENMLAALQEIEGRSGTGLYIFPSGVEGTEMAVRWAFRNNGSSLVNVKNIDPKGEQLVANKTVYAGHVLASFKLSKKPFCISLARGSVDCMSITPREDLRVTAHDQSDLKADSFVEESEWIPVENARDLENARFLIVGGRGMQHKEDAHDLKKIADALGAEFGVSRPIALCAWMPMHRMIGISGAISKPVVCIAAGVSGSAAFYAGIRKSKTIIAVNTDNRAPIIKAADIAVIDDYKAVIAALAGIMSK